MKVLILLFTLVFSGTLFAQTIDVTEIPTSDEETTTIEIKKNKGKKPTPEAKIENKWEVQDGTADLEGESAATGKEAKVAWTKACNDWKKEFRSDNKESKILSISCGTANCGGDAGSKVCSSKASYKIKTLMN